MSGATYDTGPLLAAERDDRRRWALHRRVLERGELPTVPAGVLGQAWRGGPQPRLSALLTSCRTEDLDELHARQAGGLLARAGQDDVIEASVVIGALSRADAVFTSDRTDLERLGLAAGVRLQIMDV